MTHVNDFSEPTEHGHLAKSATDKCADDDDDDSCSVAIPSSTLCSIQIGT